MLIGDEESDHDDCLDHGHHPVRHGRSQTARMRKEAYGPTKLPISFWSKEAQKWDASYLNFQDIISPQTLVVHLMIGIVCITATLVFDESESADRVSIHRALESAIVPCVGDIQSTCSASWRGNVAAHKASIAKGVLELEAAEAGRRPQDGYGKTRVGMAPIYRYYWRVG